MLNAAMRSPVRSGLEESFTMINDDLMRVGEARRLGLDWQGNKGIDTAADKSVQPMVDALQQHKTILENQQKALENVERALTQGITVKARLG